MSLNSSLLDLSEPQSDHDGAGSDGITMVNESGGDDDFEGPSSLAEHRASEGEAQEGGGGGGGDGGGGSMRPSMNPSLDGKGRRGFGKGFRGRWQWAADASDEMLFHWLCTSEFNKRCAEPGYAHSRCIVRWNPLYWGAFIVTVLSLFAGREFHICLGQGEKVNPKETRQEYEVRVHWVYCTSGAMIWVLVQSVLWILWDLLPPAVHNYDDDNDDDDKLHMMAKVVSWVVVFFFCGGNAVFLRMIRLRHLAGVRCIIICNLIFTGCMFCSLIYYVDVCAEEYLADDNDLDDKDKRIKEDDDDTQENCRKAGDSIGGIIENRGEMVWSLITKFGAVLFFIMATVIYARLWSEYKYDGRDLKRRLCETIPMMMAALAMLVLMFIALIRKDSKLQPYVWATFTG